MSGVKISELPAANAANEDDQFPVNQNGTTRRVTSAQLAIFVDSASSSMGVATLADLKELTVTPEIVITECRSVAGDQGGGSWTFRTGNQSAGVTADPESGLWAAPDTDPTGASGAWQRLFSGDMDARWFGASTIATGEENAVAIQALWTASAAARCRGVLSGGIYDLEDQLDSVDDLYAKFENAQLNVVGWSVEGATILVSSADVTIDGLDADFTNYPDSPYGTAQGGTVRTIILAAGDNGISGTESIAGRLADGQRCLIRIVAGLGAHTGNGMDILSFTGGAGGTVTITADWPIANPDATSVYQWGWNDNPISIGAGASNTRVINTRIQGISTAQLNTGGAKGIGLEAGVDGCHIDNLFVKGKMFDGSTNAGYYGQLTAIFCQPGASSSPSAPRYLKRLLITNLHAENCGSVLNIADLNSGITSATATVCSIATTTLTWGGTATGSLLPGHVIDGTGVTAKTRIVSQLTTTASVITAGAFVVKTRYMIASVGTTDFTLIGAAANTIGVQFVATGVGAGSGTAGLVGLTGTYTVDTSQTVAGPIAISAYERGNPDTQMVEVNNVLFHNCGHAPLRMVGTSQQKSGIICFLGGAGNTTISNVMGYNDSTYPYSFPGYPTDYSSRVGFGLTGPIGAVIWGWGPNITLNNIQYWGDADTFFQIQRARAMGDDGSIAGVWDVDNYKAINCRHYGTLNTVIDIDSNATFAPLNKDLLANIEIDVDTLTTGIVNSRLNGFTNTRLNVYDRGTDTRVIGTADQIFDGGNTIASFTAAGVNDFSLGDVTTGGYLRVGSHTTPTNTTAGDLTAARISIGNGSLAAVAARFTGVITGATTAWGIYNGSTAQSGVTTTAIWNNSDMSTAAAAFAVGSARGYLASIGTIGAASSITNLAGFMADSSLTVGTNSSIGYYSDIAAAATRYNFYANGTAQNVFNGNTRFGATTVPTVAVDVTGAILTTGTITAGDDFLAAAGATTTPSLRFASEETGFSCSSAGVLDVTVAGTHRVRLTSASVKLASGGVLDWTSGAASAANDTGLSRTTTATLALGNGTAADTTGTLLLATLTATGILTAKSATAVGAGANTQAFVKASSTANLGVYYGTGDPSFTAAKGSIYSKTDATTTTTRLWVNTDGGTTWTFFTSNA